MKARNPSTRAPRRATGIRPAHGGRLRPLPSLRVFERLFERWGAQNWWPAETDFEMAVGAILTQNTAWRNVERAIASLRAAGALSPAAMHAAGPERLSGWIRSAGTHRVKARRLRHFLDLLIGGFGGDMRRLLALPPDALRKRLLSVHGIGPETADCIVLYAARRPVFVIDAYTRRFLVRHGWARDGESYDALSARMARGLPADAALFGDYHALIVRLGKEHCGRRPRCRGCPLEPLLGRARGGAQGLTAGCGS